MVRFISGLLVVLLIIVLIGFGRGWLTIGSHRSDPSGDHVQVDITLDKGRIRDDASALKRSGENAAHELKESLP